MVGHNFLIISLNFITKLTFKFYIYKNYYFNFNVIYEQNTREERTGPQAGPVSTTKSVVVKTGESV